MERLLLPNPTSLSPRGPSTCAIYSSQGQRARPGRRDKRKCPGEFTWPGLVRNTYGTINNTNLNLKTPIKYGK